MAAMRTSEETAEALRGAFVEAMGRAVTGVTIVATDGPAGRLGQTVSAMCSVSAEPPTLLVCVNRRSPLAAAAAANGWFGVSILAASQTRLSQRFAGRPEDGDEAYAFDPADWHLHGQPVASAASASFVCAVDRVVDSGTHAVLFGTVVEAAAGAATALLYSRRSYGRPALVAAR